MSELQTSAPDLTSSIGAMWPPGPSTHNRMRGFYDQAVVRDVADVAVFAQEFAAERERLHEHPDLDRLSIRLVGSFGILAALQDHGIHVEAAIPLGNLGEDLAIAYTAWNSEARRASSGHLASELAMLKNATSSEVSPIDYRQELGLRGYTAHIIDKDTSEADKQALVERFVDMYKIFNYDRGDVETLLFNPANTIAYIEHEGQVISTAMAEAGEILVQDLEPLAITEITEASTHPDHRGNGLYKLVSGFLVSELLRRAQQTGQPLNALYGESNLAMPGVILAAHHNGRRFSHFDAERAGINRPDFGILQQNFHVADGTEQRPYNDFAVSYYNLNSPTMEQSYE